MTVWEWEDFIVKIGGCVCVCVCVCARSLQFAFGVVG